MLAIMRVNEIFTALAAGVLFLHAIFIFWVVFGAFFTRSRPVLRWLHIVSLVWGILTELAPWPCPLTTMEDWLEKQAGVQPYQGGFLLHYLDAFVYPSVSSTVLAIAGVTVCVLNLGIYARRFRKARSRRISQYA